MVELDELIEGLEAVDDRLREVYRALAGDPGLALSHDVELRDLHERRRELAEQVGLATLAALREPLRSSRRSTVAAAPQTLERA